MHRNLFRSLFMGCDACIQIKPRSGKQNRCIVLALERKLNGERNPKGTEQQIQPAANCCMNQPSNIVLLDTSAVRLCVSDCQGHGGKKKQNTGRKQRGCFYLPLPLMSTKISCISLTFPQATLREMRHFVKDATVQMLITLGEEG